MRFFNRLLHSPASRHVAVLFFALTFAVSSYARDKQTAEDKLVEAARAGNTTEVQQLIKKHVNVNAAVNVNGLTPLIVASQSGYVECVKVLLEAGAKVDSAARSNFTPLMVASQEGHADVVQILLGAGANVNAVAIQGVTALAQASQGGHTDVVKLLLAAGAKVDAPESTGATSLYLASQEGRADVVILLLAAGARVDTTDDRGATPLHLASQNCHPDVIELLLAAHANVDGVAKNGYTPLIAATLPNPRREIGMQGTEHGMEPIYDEIKRDHAGTVRVLLAAGANVNARGNAGETPLHMAIANGYSDVVESLRQHGARE